MLAVITNYYNPNNDPQKLNNYKIFLKNIDNLNLYTLELNQNSPINKSSNNISINIDAKNNIWQQYRLINILIENLPDRYRSVAWVDCDIIFEDKEWAKKATKCLEKNLFIQLFYKAHFLDKDNKINETRYSCGSFYSKYKTPFDKKAWSGFAWACDLDFIKKWKIYDYWMWSSDLAILIGLLGLFDANFLKLINKEMRDHYLEWAIPFHKEAKSSFGFLDTEIKHLWHGDMKKRNYNKRIEILKDFDPKKDIKINEKKCFEWCSNKLKMHEEMNSLCVNYDKN